MQPPTNGRHGDQCSEPRRAAADGVGQLDEGGRRHAEGDAGDDHLGGQTHREVDRSDRRHCQVVDVEQGDDPIADDRRREGGHDRVVADAPDRLHLEGEHEPGDRHAEHGAEAAGDGGDEQQPPFGCVEREEAAGDELGQAARHLDRRALPAGRAAEQVGEDRGAVDERRHAARDPCRRRVDLVDDQVAPGRRRAGEVEVDDAQHEAGDRQQEQQPAVRLSCVGGPRQRLEEQGRGHPGEHADAPAEHGHAGDVQHRSDGSRREPRARHLPPGPRHRQADGSSCARSPDGVSCGASQT